MNITWLLSLIRTLGPKLPEAWPHIMNIKKEVDAIAFILFGTTRTPRMSLPQAEGEELVKIAQQRGIVVEDAQAVAASFEVLNSRVA